MVKGGGSCGQRDGPHDEWSEWSKSMISSSLALSFPYFRLHSSLPSDRPHPPIHPLIYSSTHLPTHPHPPLTFVNAIN